MATGRIRIGIGGWTFEPWRGAFYPEGLAQRRELKYASQHLTSIEINGTYYGSQKPESFVKWHDETFDDFVFSLMAPRFATNRRVFAEAAPSIEKFFASGVTELKSKLGPVNWQFMATKKFDSDDFEAFLKFLPASADGIALRDAVEPRPPSFQCADFVTLARAYNVAIITPGDAGSPQIAHPTADFAYARIMGTTEAEPAGYAPAALDRWAARARTWAGGSTPEALETFSPEARAEPRDVFLYVISGHKPANPAAAMALIDRLA